MLFVLLAQKSTGNSITHIIVTREHVVVHLLSLQILTSNFFRDAGIVIIQWCTLRLPNCLDDSHLVRPIYYLIGIVCQLAGRDSRDLVLC